MLHAFRRLFEGTKYKHRNSGLGDWVARHLYEDLYALGRSTKLRNRIEAGKQVLNRQNRRRGIQARRGDGTFGELIPGMMAVFEPGFAVGGGPISNVEIGVEVKVIAKAMLKQLGRVENDLRDQVQQFNRGANSPICIGVVGINHAEYCVSYEGDRVWRTDGVRHKHPVQEAGVTEQRLQAAVAPKFDELVFLRYRATNDEPYLFEWVSYADTFQDYGAALTRISRTYDERFGHAP